MKSQTEATLNIQDIPQIFSRYWLSILTSALCAALAAAVLSYYLPKKYKAYFVLTIYSKYFQSPLIGDFIPGLSESGERSQRESLIRQVLTPEYLDSLGAKYGIYSAQETTLPSWRSWMWRLHLATRPNNNSLLSLDREDLRSRIEIFSMNSTTFNVGFLSANPEVAYHVARDIHEEMIRSLLDLRMRTMANVRDAIQTRVDSLTLSMALPSTTSAVGSSSVRNELESIRVQIRSLGAEYTDQHPQLILLREREKVLVERLATRYQSKSFPSSPRALAEGSTDSNRDIYADLTKKLNYLTIAIDTDREHQEDYFATLEPPLYPSSALGPTRVLFVLWGFCLGFFGAIFVSAIREYFDRSTLHTAALAQALHLPVLGELPALPKKASS